MQRLVSTIGFWALWWLVLFGIWEAMVGTGESTETVAGAVAAAFAALLAEAVRRQGLFAVRVERRALLWIGLVPLRIVSGFAAVSWVLLERLAGKRVQGRYRAVPFPAGRADPDSRGRRVLATLVGSVGPNTIVVDLDCERGLALRHELPAGSADRMP
jgi:hypothetical protein